MTELGDLALKYEVVQRARILQRHGTSYERALRARDRWEGRWEAALDPIWDQFLQPRDWDALVHGAQLAWGDVGKSFPTRVLTAIGGLVRGQLGSVIDFAHGIMGVYFSLAKDEGEDAGQHTLDQLGLNRTFRWTGVRDMSRDMFAVRGSKIVQNLYGNHVDRLRTIIADATDPKHPRPSAEITKDIKKEWPLLKQREANRIARTESAAVWNTTTFNAMVANDVSWFDVGIAHGPSVAAKPVCPKCLGYAAKNPYPSNEVPELPAHPYCRCAYIPALSKDWLPPAEPWTGNEPELPIYPAPAP